MRGATMGPENTNMAMGEGQASTNDAFRLFR